MIDSMKRMITPQLRTALLILLLSLVVSACSPLPIPPPAPGDEPIARPTDLEGLYRLMVGTGKVAGMVPVPEQLITSTYGIADSSMTDSVFMVAEDVARADEIILIEAISEETAEGILQQLAARLAEKETAAKDSSPDQYAIILGARTLHTGRQLALIVSPEAQALAKVYEENWGK